jgi:hypothetical protein
VTDICLFEGHALELSPKVLDIAWRNYFGAAHVYTPEEKRTTGPLSTPAEKRVTGSLSEDVAEPFHF